MKKYQKTALLEVVERTKCGGYLVQNEGDPSDRWVIPQETFEATYKEVPGSEMLCSTEGLVHENAEFGFDIAICLLKEGERVARKGWNGKGMFAVYQKGYPDGIPCNKQTAEAWGYKEGDLFKVRPYLQLKTAQGDHAMWTPSTSDVLADDWVVVY